MQTAVNCVIPLFVVLFGAITGYQSRWGETNKSIDTMIPFFVACHVCLVFFPLQILSVGKIWSVEEMAGHHFVVFNVNNFGAVLLNIGISCILMWALTYVVGAVRDFFKELLS